MNNMKLLLESINRGILRGLRENNINLLADLDDDNLDLQDSLLTKSVNKKDNQILLIKLRLIDSINSKQISGSLKEQINNPNNFRKFKGLIPANDKEHLKELIRIGLKLFGDDGNFNWIDTSDVIDMSHLFNTNLYFNGHIELWDVSNVTDMSFMFYKAGSFNQPIGDWNVSNVTDFSGMFAYTKKFNLPIGDWDVSNVKDMHYMFYEAMKFTQPIGDWDVSNVTNMYGMFYYARSFNQDISTWHIKNNTSIDSIFKICPIKYEYTPKLYKISNNI